MVKWLVVFIFALGLVLVSVPRVLADSPQPYQYSLIRCSGLGIDLVVSGEQQFDTLYGYIHNLTTDAQWQATYISRVNEYASMLGCPAVLNDNGDLTFQARIYAPVYQWIVEHGPTP
jgi:hypothetical protein